MRATNRHERAKLWLSSPQQGSVSDGYQLASQYPLASGLIVRAAKSARSRAKHRAMEPKDIAAGVRSVIDERLGPPKAARMECESMGRIAA